MTALGMFRSRDVTGLGTTAALKSPWKAREGEEARRSPASDCPPLRRRNSARCLRLSSEVCWELEEERGGGGGGSSEIRRKDLREEGYSCKIRNLSNTRHPL
ncbi:hypothetical protein ZIOFF_000976 [Zingiber officinale]|uniref:Uncharacterized protein n=1 Tax=Zingiber officinale TaxID=94328 RepID=A0A8J5I934_ZINOF|nr:hypothetical protein ZIOFF_000976 [Zingiber officinale]